MYLYVYIAFALLKRLISPLTVSHGVCIAQFTKCKSPFEKHLINKMCLTPGQCSRSLLALVLIVRIQVRH